MRAAVFICSGVPSSLELAVAKHAAASHGSGTANHWIDSGGPQVVPVGCKETYLYLPEPSGSAGIDGIGIASSASCLITVTLDLTMKFNREAVPLNRSSFWFCMQAAELARLNVGPWMISQWLACKAVISAARADLQRLMHVLLFGLGCYRVGSLADSTAAQ